MNFSFTINISDEDLAKFGAVLNANPAIFDALVKFAMQLQNTAVSGITITAAPAAPAPEHPPAPEAPPAPEPPAEPPAPPAAPVSGRALGKAPALRDPRNIQLLAINKAPTVPTSYDVDHFLKVTMPEQMFGNDQVGDCVIAGRANYTRRAEYYQQRKGVPITTQDVLREYFRETGGDDTGLVLLTSLKEWRKAGWYLSEDGHTYSLYAFAELKHGSKLELELSVSCLLGAYIGLLLPTTACDQIDAGQTWDVAGNPATDPDAQPGSWGGHCVYVVAYDPEGPTCVTWGQRQKMTWAFYDAYCDEAYGIVDNRDRWVKHSPIDDAKLQKLLAQITHA